MANIFLDSAAGGAGTGADWTNAYTTMAALITGGLTNADIVYVANTHSESTAAAVTLAFPTTQGGQVLSVTPSGASGNTGLTAGAIIAVGNASQLLTIGGHIYCYGVEFRGGTAASAVCSINLASSLTGLSQGIILDTCKLTIQTSTANAKIRFGYAAATTAVDGYCKLINTVFKFGAITNSLEMRTGRNHFVGCTIDGAGATPTTLITGVTDANGSLLCEASDISGEVYTNLANQAWTSAYDVTLRKCKLPASVAVVTGTHTNIGGLILKMHDCDSADTHIRFAEHSWQGSTVQQISTLIRTGGATQADTTAYSWLMTGSANCKFWAPLASPEFSIYNTAVGSAKTATVEILRDSVTNLQDNEIWLEVQYLGTSGVPQGSMVSDRMTDILATAADQTTSSVTWDTTGMTNANKQKLAVTFTPQEAGYIHCRVMLAANTSVYVDPKITIS